MALQASAGGAAREALSHRENDWRLLEVNHACGRQGAATCSDYVQKGRAAVGEPSAILTPRTPLHALAERALPAVHVVTARTTCGAAPVVIDLFLMCGVERNLGSCGAWRTITFALGAVALSGCTSSYQRELFIFQASRADYPVMLSSVPHGGTGEPLVARAEMRSDSVSTSNGYGNAVVTTTWSASGTSPLNVSDHLARQVLPATRWVQIDGITYTGEDALQSVGFAALRSSKREINVEGAAHR